MLGASYLFVSDERASSLSHALAKREGRGGVDAVRRQPEKANLYCLSPGCIGEWRAIFWLEKEQRELLPLLLLAQGSPLLLIRKHQERGRYHRQPSIPGYLLSHM